jgi:hypothetical protein
VSSTCVDGEDAQAVIFRRRRRMCAAFAENMISDTPTRVQPQTVHASQNKTTNPSLAAMQGLADD